MVASEADLCNIALGLVGVRDYIDDLDEDSDAAQACKVHYQQVRDRILRSAMWKFANQFTTLALSTVVRTGWGFVYMAPSDFVRDVRLWATVSSGGDTFAFWPPPGAQNGGVNAGFYTAMRALGADQRVPYDLFSDQSQKGTYLIGTDLEMAGLEYIRRVKEVGLFPEAFVDAVAAALAAKLALTLPVKLDLGRDLAREAKVALNEAIALEANLGREDIEPESAFTRER